MINQSELNSVSLEKASEMISGALIKERINLKNKKVELEHLKEKYQEDYILANDGDARENAPLEQAIQNLKVTTGDIVAITKKYQQLDAIEDSLYLNATYDYEGIMEGVRVLSPDSSSALCSAFKVNSVDEIPNAIASMTYEEFDDAVMEYDEYYGSVVMGALRVDFPEDHPIWKSRRAIEEEALARRSTGLAVMEYRVLSELNEARKMKQVPPYNYCGLVVMYTTVRLHRGSQYYTYKIYPKGLSFIDDGIMAANSRLATALMGKKKGDKVSIRHGSQDTVLVYEIVDIY